MLLSNNSYDIYITGLSKIHNTLIIIYYTFKSNNLTINSNMFSSNIETTEIIK